MAIVFIPSSQSRDGRQMYEPHQQGNVPQIKKPENIRAKVDPVEAMISRFHQLLNHDISNDDLLDQDFSSRRKI